jgi:hypothetical protein
MNLFKKIKTLVKENKSKQVETIIISQKQCPHCVTRGMFIFKDTSIQRPSNVNKNEKSK